jgi:adhesin transport system outer membrane protein
VAFALARRPEIQGAQALIARRQAELELARSAWWPSIQYALNPGYGGADAANILGSNQGSNYTSLRGNINVTQKVYDFGGTPARIDAAEGMKVGAQAGKELTAEKVASDTLNAYMQAEVAQEQLETALEEIESMRTMLNRIEQRVKAGLSGQSDRSAALISVQRAQVEAERARTTFEATMSTLVSYVGVWPTSLQPLERSLTQFARQPSEQPDFEQTPAVRAARTAVSVAKATQDATKADQYPSIGLGASRNQSTASRDASYNATWIGVALQGSFSLGGAAKQRVAAAAADLASAERDLEAKRLDARTSYAVAQRHSAGARTRLISLEGITSLSTQTKDLYWQEYMVDKRSLANVLNAQRDIHLARLDYVQAQGDAVGADIAQLVAAGRLIAFLELSNSTGAAAPWPSASKYIPGVSSGPPPGWVAEGTPRRKGKAAKAEKAEKAVAPPAPPASSAAVAPPPSPPAAVAPPPPVAQPAKSETPPPVPSETPAAEPGPEKAAAPVAAPARQGAPLRMAAPTRGAPAATRPPPAAPAAAAALPPAETPAEQTVAEPPSAPAPDSAADAAPPQAGAATADNSADNPADNSALRARRVPAPGSGGTVRPYRIAAPAPASSH